MGLLSVIRGFNIICGHFISGHSKIVSFPGKICLLKHQYQFGNLPESFLDGAERVGEQGSSFSQELLPLALTLGIKCSSVRTGTGSVRGGGHSPWAQAVSERCRGSMWSPSGAFKNNGTEA